MTVPERFAIPDHTDRLKKAAAIDRLKDTLSESYFRRPCAVGVQQVDEWIEEAHYRIARDQNHANMLVGTNPDLLADIDRAWSSSGITSTFTAGFGLWSMLAGCSTSRQRRRKLPKRRKGIRKVIPSIPSIEKV